MLEVNKLYVGDTVEVMKKIDDKSIQLILTSPPYNSSSRNDDIKYPHGEYNDNITSEQYVEWMVDIFKEYQRILKDKGVVAFNLSYTKYDPSLPYKVIAEILNKTDFIVIDTLAWEKSSVVPMSTSPDRLTRKCEFVYIFVKKNFQIKFDVNKEVSKVNDKTGQSFFKTYYNIFKARNNDGKVEGHNATFSTEFANFFVELYSFEDTTVLDNFIGTGTTAISCIRKKRNYIGIDNTQIYINHANQRIENELNGNNLEDPIDKDLIDTEKTTSKPKRIAKKIETKNQIKEIKDDTVKPKVDEIDDFWLA